MIRTHGNTTTRKEMKDETEEEEREKPLSPYGGGQASAIPVLSPCTNRVDAS